MFNIAEASSSFLTPSRKADRRLASRRGYTMSEIIIVIVVLGLLAAIAVPIYNNVRNAGADNVKIKNADMLNQMMTAIHNGGVDTTVWADATATIAALKSGVAIPSANALAAGQEIRLEKQLNPAAYSFTKGTVDKAPIFAPILGQPTVTP